MQYVRPLTPLLRRFKNSRPQAGDISQWYRACLACGRAWVPSIRWQRKVKFSCSVWLANECPPTERLCFGEWRGRIWSQVPRLYPLWLWTLHRVLPHSSLQYATTVYLSNTTSVSTIECRREQSDCEVCQLKRKRIFIRDSTGIWGFGSRLLVDFMLGELSTLGETSQQAELS